MALGGDLAGLTALTSRVFSAGAGPGVWNRFHDDFG